ncbi:ABC transporter ATP-binding protein [Kaistia sp. 32K]|uniref:ABC transporter ATP-binding protein n=1 Tax=Kaistia sp. 32K TaxID=2795690 RepID=UPI001916AF3B|nr:ABC transporter ATP-binding protein [Kaistia sp. 32K]BCP55248.1 ABC transporter ATP-binding protein [Kaistia sp. 32K]
MKTLSVSGLQKRFEKTLAVADVSFEAERGECVALLGPSGCGKTSTLRIVAGLEFPDAGTISIAGADVTRKRPYERNIGIVFQDYALFPHMTVQKNIAYGLRFRSIPEAEVAERIHAVLGIVKLQGYEARFPSQLSGGQQQRVALARALVTRPDVLLLDEPLSNLDAKLRDNLRHEIRQIIDASGVTTIIVTHDQQEAMSLADRVIVMNEGRVIQDDVPRQVYQAPRDRFTAEFIGKMNWLNPPSAERDDGAAFSRLLSRHPGKLVGVRPENIIVGGPDIVGDDHLSFDIVVEATEFLGPHVQIWSTLNGAPFTALHASNSSALPVTGDRVMVSFRLNDLIAVPAEQLL